MENNAINERDNSCVLCLINNSTLYNYRWCVSCLKTRQGWKCASHYEPQHACNDTCKMLPPPSSWETKPTEQEPTETEQEPTETEQVDDINSIYASILDTITSIYDMIASASDLFGSAFTTVGTCIGSAFTTVGTCIGSAFTTVGTCIGSAAGFFRRNAAGFFGIHPTSVSHVEESYPSKARKEMFMDDFSNDTSSQGEI